LFVEISVAIYEEITGLAQLPPPVDEADYERRKHRRVPFGHRAIISPERKGVDNTPAVVMVRDVSVGGVCFLNDEALKPGTPFVIEFKGHEDRPVKLHGAVMRCEAGGAGGAQFVIGASFDALLTEELPLNKPAEIPKLAELAFDESDKSDVKTPLPALAESKPASSQNETATETISEEKSETTQAAGADSAAPVVSKSSALFKAADPSAIKEKSDDYWSTGEILETAPQPSAPKPAPEMAAPTFRDVPMPEAAPDPEIQQAPESQPEPESKPEPENEITISMALGPQNFSGGGKNHEVLARVKELLVKQEKLIEAQRQELSKRREEFKKEVATMRSELEETKNNLAELRAKCEADDNAIADLANFVKEHAGSESPDERNEAA
jgi:DNA-binding transcriptional MerR regulator